MIKRPIQPDLIDYLHRLTRGLDVYLKIGTVRYRTSLHRYDEQTIGVEIGQDVESIDLDRTLEDFASTQSYLMSIIQKFGEHVGIGDFVNQYMNAECPRVLTEASGGVPRDCLTILVSAIQDARERSPETSWITPRNIYRAAKRGFTETKLVSMRSDVGTDTTVLELLFQDLVNFCLAEKGKTAFLVAEDEIGTHEFEHDLIQQLMDLKLIHVIEANTSAASGRQGRFEAYALDAAVFMEPRRRNIEVVEFWRTDDQRRRVGIREAPVYPLDRLRDLITSQKTAPDTEEFLRQRDAETANDLEH